MCKSDWVTHLTKQIFYKQIQKLKMLKSLKGSIGCSMNFENYMSHWSQNVGSDTSILKQNWGI